MSEETDQNGEEEEVVDEWPQRRREWSGPMRSIVLPIVVVAAIVGAIWLIEKHGHGRAGSNGDNVGIVQRPADKLAKDRGVGAERGKVAPDFILPTVDGATVRLSDFAGRPVFINFWATWCEPCRKEMPEIIAARQRNADGGLAVIAVNLREDKDTAAKFVREFGMDFPAALDFRGEVGAAFHVAGLPASFLIDRNGVVQVIFFGPLSSDEMDRQLRKIM